MFQYERQALETFLSAAKFPCSREQLLSQSEKAQLPHQVVSLIQRLDDRQYTSASDAEQDMLSHKA